MTDGLVAPASSAVEMAQQQAQQQVPRIVAAALAGRGGDSKEADGIRFRARPGHVHRTWAGTFSSLPELYIQPESEAEVEQAVALARRCRRRLVVAGCAHSPSNLTCTSAWMLNLDRLARVLAVDAGAGLVRVQAGIRLRALNDALAARGLALPSLGSIDEQSLAGALATGTHGSSLAHGLLSEAVVGLRLTRADGRTVDCAADDDDDGGELFRGALLSLGALGVVVALELRVVPAFRLRWHQTVDADRRLFAAWPRRLWSQAEFVRVWWFPYTRRAVVWRADKVADDDDDDDDDDDPPPGWCDRPLGFHLYRNLLLLAHWLPRLLPWIEWFVCGMQYGFGDGAATSATQPSARALLMNCLYAQTVNEWAVPLHRGPEALRRLGAWLARLPPGHPDYVEHGIPFSADGLWVHAPVEVRVAAPARPARPRPLLDPTVDDGPTLYLNATLYRPYGRDPPCRDRYYAAFEWLMRDLGGRPHWAKNFTAGREDLDAMYGPRLARFRRLRHALDPDGLFLGPWHREHLMPDEPPLPLEEVQTDCCPAPGGGLRVFGCVPGCDADDEDP